MIEVISINIHPNYKPSKKIRDAIFNKAMKEHRKIIDRFNARQKGHIDPMKGMPNSYQETI